MSNLTLHLLRLRVRWYFRALRQFEIKFRQTLMLIFGLGPGLILAFAIFYMIQEIFSPDIQLIDNFLMLCLIEVLCLLWVMCCGDAVKGEPLDQYVKSLPLSKFQRYWVDLGVFFVANAIGWVLLIFAVGSMLLSQDMSTLSIIVLLIQVAILIALVLTVQMLWFRGTRAFLSVILIINFLFIVSNGLHSYLLLLGVIGVFGMILLLNLVNIIYRRDTLSIYRKAN